MATWGRADRWAPPCLACHHSPSVVAGAGWEAAPLEATEQAAHGCGACPCGQLPLPQRATGRGRKPAVLETFPAAGRAVSGAEGAWAWRAAQEEIRDLLAADAGLAQGVHIREVVGGGVCLSGAAEREVTSQAEMAAVLEQARPQTNGEPEPQPEKLQAGAGAAPCHLCQRSSAQHRGCAGRFKGLGADSR